MIIKYVERRDLFWLFGLLFISIDLFLFNNYLGLFTTNWIGLIMYIYILIQRKEIYKLKTKGKEE